VVGDLFLVSRQYESCSSVYASGDHSFSHSHSYRSSLLAVQQRLVSRTPSEMNDSISFSQTSFASFAGADHGDDAPENSQEDPFWVRAMQKTESKGM
jgi:hypothetical protein